MTTANQMNGFAFEELTDRDLAILDHYVWGKEVPFWQRPNDPIAIETMNLRRKIDTELVRRKALSHKRTYRTNEHFRSVIGTEAVRLAGIERDRV